MNRLTSIILLCSAVACADASSSELRTSVSTGYDSFIDRYTILEDDTSEAINEQYISLLNSFMSGGPRPRLSFSNMFRYGNQTVDENVSGSLTLGSRESFLVELRNYTHLKFFRESSDYEFGNDYMQSNTYLKMGKKMPGGLKISSKSRFEIVDYDKRTSFDYDYRYFDTGLEVEKGSYFSRFARVSASAGYRDVPDTTALSYGRILADIEIRLGSGTNTSFQMSVSGDRRNYREEIERSCWTVYIFSDLAHEASGGVRYTLRAESEHYIFDTPSPTFFDTHFLRGGLKAGFPAGGAVTISAEPRYARMLCPDHQEERYWEGSVVLAAELSANGKYWLTFSYEPGFRGYLMEENDIYSDFYINRLSLMGSIEAVKDLTLNVFLTHDPEKHTRRYDDFSMTLLSVSLTKRF